MIYDIFFQNNGSKQIFEVLRVEDKSDNPYYLSFKEFEMPEKMEDGEYTYVVFANTLREDKYRYEYKADILDSVVVVDGKEYKFKDLKPLTGLLRMGNPKKEMIYNETNKESKEYYYK